MPGRGDAPGANSRGRGGKFKKFTRGGGKHFSRDLRPLDADGNEVSMWSSHARKGKDGDDEDGDDSEGDEEDSEEGSDDDSDAGPSQPQQELTREERRLAKKAQKDAAVARRQKGQVQVGDLPSEDEDEDEEDDDMPANPNHTKASRQQTRVAPPAVDAATEGVSKLSVNPTTMSRREREALEKQQAAERYRKLHAEGKTDEAKADMARLQLIREKREADAARKQAEKEEKDALEKERRVERETREAKRRDAALGKAPKKGKK
ncbi:hypothetical protein F5X97DRAFT_313435 [Nemania serpens]|nr:hypothetical protein F5X97DRAFT_313435 [Nemania serpens]